MEKRINVAELLKDCPKGMELDCTIYENVEFDYIEQNPKSAYPIHCLMKTNGGYNALVFTHNGCSDRHPNAKCVIFPKGKTTWEGFVPTYEFKDGDILKSCNGSVFIYKKSNVGGFGCYCGFDSLGDFTISKGYYSWTYSIERLATEEEKERLFQAIKDNGYEWNAETKTLEKLVEPKFKVGDRIKKKGDYISGFITLIDSDNFYKVEYGNGGVSYTNVKAQDEWELVPNKFDISTLVPFESKVLVRNDNEQRWIPAFWGGKREDGYVTTFGWSKYCVPYKGNEHLLDKTDDCNSFYKTWE